MAQSTDDLTRPIQASPDGHFMVQPDGKPFFWLGDTAWELFHRLNREEADLYLKDRAAKGFNVIQANAIGLLDGLKSPNAYGELPLINEDPGQPNPRYFEHVDWIVDRARKYGIRIAMLPVWGANLVGGYGPPDGKIFNRSNAKAYAQWLATRYRAKGIIWVLGGDTVPLYPTEPAPGETVPTFKKNRAVTDFRPVYDAMAEGIIAGEGGNPFITFHPCPVSPLGVAQPRTSLFFADREWFDLNMIQSSHTMSEGADQDGGKFDEGAYYWNPEYNYLPIRREYDSKPARPVIDAEPRYEDHPTGGEKPYWRSYDMRNAAYHSVFAGAAGHTYGNFNIWDLYSEKTKPAPGSLFAFDGHSRTEWSKAIDAPGAGQMQHVKALMLSRPYFTRIPDQSLIIGDAGKGTSHIGATRDREGRYAMIYLPHGQPVTVDMSKFAGSSVAGWWFDPRTGTASRIAGALPANSAKQFVPPSAGPENDWILVLDNADQNYPSPGLVK